MSVNIWGSGIKKETTGGDNSLSTLINHFVKKSGDVMRGVLNMGGNRVVSIGNPESGSDAVNKSYCDSVFLRKIIDNNVLKIGSDTDSINSIEFIVNNEAYLTLGNNFINVNRKFLLNLREPIGDSEAVTKRYVINNAVRKGDERGLPRNLVVGTLDEKYLELIRNGQRYIVLASGGERGEGIIELVKPIDVNEQPLFNLKDPRNLKDATHKNYVDTGHRALSSLITTKIGEINELISKNEAGIVYLKRDTDSYLHLNNNMINVDKDLNLTNNSRIHNVPIPSEAFDPVNKQYVDNRLVHIGGNSDIVGGLKVGTNDILPFHLIRNREIYITLDNDLIDCKNHRIINISDPVENNDAVNKSYCNSNKLSRNHVAYIPLNHIPYGFSVVSTTIVEGGNSVGNILNDDVNSVWEVSIAPIFPENNSPFFIITCPNAVIVWKMVMILPNSDIPHNFSINIYGIDDDGNRTSITSGITLHIFISEAAIHMKLLNNVNSHKTKYQKYRIEFVRRNEVPVSFKISRFQMFVFND